MWFRQVAWVDPTPAAHVLAGHGRLSLLQSAMTHPTLGRYSYLAVDPFGLFTCRDDRGWWNGTPLAGDPIGALRSILNQYPLEPRSGLPPFQGGAVGYIGYEFGWALEGRQTPVRPADEDVHLAFYDLVVAFDHHERCCWLMSSGWPEPTDEGRRRRATSRLAQVADRLAGATTAREPVLPHVAWRPDVSRAAYRAAVDRVQHYIRAGDIYQANIAQRFAAEMPAQLAPLDLYAGLCAANPAPFAAYLDCGATKICSTSPELFLRCDGTHVETRPIKGTVRRQTDPMRDAAAAATLAGSRKDQAENVMIVDLLRNDLSRVCAPDSVDVPVLCGVETYAGVHHLVSAVTGRLAQGQDMLDLIAATFPGGSITGAPKIRAMEIIAEIERRPRGVYCGAIGAIGFDGSLVLNIAIRTIIARPCGMELWAGGGITMLSDPDAEYEETLAKAQRILDAFAPTRLPAEAEA